MAPRKPRTQKTRSIRHPKWVHEQKMDSAYLAGLISEDTYHTAKHWILEMREGNHPDAMYGIPEYTLRNEPPDGTITKTPTTKYDLATFIRDKAPGGAAFWSNILYAIGRMENPQYGPSNASNRLQARIAYLHDIGVLKPHTKEFIFKIFLELEQGAYPQAKFDPAATVLKNAFDWRSAPPGPEFWGYIHFIDEKFNTHENEK